MSVNDYRVAEVQASEAGEETEEETSLAEEREGETEEEPEVAIPLVDVNYRPVADPDNHAGEVFEYSPRQDPEDFVGGPDAVDELPDPNYDPEIPPGEDPVPAETVDPDDAEEGEVVDGTTLAPGLIDEEEQAKRKAAEAEAAENAAKNQQALLEANAIAVTPEGDPNEDTPAETVLPEEEPEDDGEEVEFVDAPEDEEYVGPVGHPEEAAIQRQRTLEVTSPAQAAQEAGETEDTYEEDKARATSTVPTQANNKQEIRDYLTYEHGIDPDDLQDQSKAELLALVADLAE